MRQNWKFHVIALSLISGIILILYTVIGPHKTVVVQQAPSHVVKMYAATWGRNCNPFITTENNRLMQLKLHPDQVEKLDPVDRPKSFDALPMVQSNNVLATVGALCDGKETCIFDITSDNLQSEPLSSCYKRLEVGFRCFEFDRLHTFEMNQNETLNIDCHESAPEPAAK